MAVLFAARRLGPDAVALLLAGRAGSVPSGLVHDVPVLTVGGLPAAAAADLLPHATSPAVLDRLVAETSGNPLALLEVSTRLDAAQLLGTAPLPDPLPAGEAGAAVARGGGGRAVARSRACRAAAGAVGHVVRRRPRPSPRSSPVRTRPRGSSTRPASAASWCRRADGTRSGTRCCAAPCSSWPRPRSSGRRTRPWPTRCPPATGHGPGTAPSPRSARTTGWPTSWSGSRTRTGTDSGYAAASAALERAATLTDDHDLAARRLAGAAHDAFVAGDVARVRAPGGPGARRGRTRPRPRRGAVHARDAGAVRRVGPPVGRAPGRRLPPARRPAPRPGADRAGGGPLPPQRRRRDGGVRPADRRGRRPRGPRAAAARRLHRRRRPRPHRGPGRRRGPARRRTTAGGPARPAARRPGAAADGPRRARSPGRSSTP